MQRQERNVTREIVRGAFAAIWLPFSWAAGLPRAAGVLLRRVRSPEERSASAAREKFDTERWSLELLKHLEWRRFEELCVAYFEALGFSAQISHSRTDGAVEIGLCAAGARLTAAVGPGAPGRPRSWSIARRGTPPASASSRCASCARR